MSTLEKSGEEVANFSVRLKHLYRVPDDPLHLVLDLDIVQGKHRQLLTVDYDRLGQLDIQNLVPGCVYLKRGAKGQITKQIRLDVSQALQGDQIGTLYTQSGWCNHKLEKIFIAGGVVISKGGITAPSNDLISERIAQLHLAVDSTLTPAQSSELVLRALLTYEGYAIPVFSYALYGMLHSIWVEANLPTACVLNLIGTQGYGKTTLARTFCALYNDATGHIADFYDASSTEASLRRALNIARDRVVTVDDLCRSTSRKEMASRRDLASRLIRRGANESPSSMMDGAEITHFECRGGLVMTGEIPFKEPSDVTRCVIIDVKQPLRKGNPDDRILAATAAAAYIQWLCAHFSDEMARLKADFQTFSDRDSSKTDWRLKKSLFQLSWAFDSFLRFSKSVGAINDVVQRQLEERTADIFQKIFTYEETLAQSVDNAQPFRWIQLIMEGASRNAFPYKLKPNCICVRPTDLTKFLRAALKDPTLQGKEVIKQLKLQHRLLMDKSGKSTKKVSNIRMLNIKISDK